MAYQKVDTKEIGLDMGLVFMKFFLKTEYLHYGFWTPDMSVDVLNFRQAQENYTQQLLENIPESVKTILDVGCGSGKVAEQLLAKGYQIEAVSPSSRLTEYAKKLLNNQVHVYENIYEEAPIQKTYDLVLFSESFQYIEMHKLFQNALKHLNPNGYVLICDFFQRDGLSGSPLGGGHKLGEYYQILAQYPFEVLKDQEITDNIAPTMQVVNDLTLQVVQPLWYMLIDVVSVKIPFIARVLKWWFRKKIEKIQNKHFKGERNPENFKKFKSYRLILLQKK